MNEKISAILLSGGQGRRFGDRDKGLVRWRGKPLVTHIIDRLETQVEQIVISCNRNIPTYQSLGFDVVTDHNGDYHGPLAGVQAAAGSIRNPWCLICPNDTPLIPADLTTRLLRILITTDSQVAYPLCGTRHHYLPALVRSEILDTVDNYLKEGGRSLHHWYRNFKVATADYSEQAAAFANINSPLTLEQLDQG